MTDDVTASTTEPTAPPEADATAGGEQQEDTLDKLLKEFNEETPEPQTETPEPPAPKTAETPSIDQSDIADLKSFAEEFRQERASQDIAKVVQSIKKDRDGLNDIPDDWIEGRLEVEARKDQRVAMAYTQRHKNPAAWAGIVDGLGKKLAGEVTRADAQLTADREAAQASVRNVSTSPPAAPTLSNEELNKLSDSEFEARKQAMARGR